MLNVWTAKSGTSLGTLEEGNTYSISLPVSSSTGLTFTKISGQLPGGLRIRDDQIVGTPFEVSQPTVFTFVIRASNGIEIADRTFTITVNGADDPEWITPEGQLSINPNGQAFVLENTYINFQLSAIDYDLPAGDKLEFFIQNGDGTLPPGLSLNTNGIITGIIDPILSLDISAGSGYYDTNLFDSNSFDFGIFSGFIDEVGGIRTPKKLNRYYEFFVSISDRRTISKRKFRIYVVSEDFLRADNTLLQVGNGAFTADGTYLRAPIWLTAGNLGIKRADNNVTIFLDTFDPSADSGPLTYQLLPTNYGTYKLKSTGEITRVGRYEISGVFPEFRYILLGAWRNNRSYQVGDAVFYSQKLWVCQEANTNQTPGSSGIYWNRDIDSSKETFRANRPNNWTVLEPETRSSLPPGLFLDPDNSELFGFVPFQPAVTREYNFTINAVKYDSNASTEVEVAIAVRERAPLGQTYININVLPQDDVNYIVNDNIRIGNFYYRILSYEEINPLVGSKYAKITLDQNLKIDVPQGVVVRRRYIESTLGFTTAVSPKKFVISILGEVDSVIRWVTQPTLGTIKANFFSRFFVEARTSVPNGIVTYKVVGGRLPPGLTLDSSGEIVGKVRQFGTVDVPGLTIYDNNETTFDGGSTTFDRSYTVTIQAQDQYFYSAIRGNFTIKVEDPDTKLYSNLYVKPFQKPEKRTAFSNFINDSNIFTPSKIYRPNDPQFGIQKDLKMLIYAGIETVNINEYVSALSRNSSNKRYKLGDVKKAVARSQGTNEIIYEVIYVDIVDSYEIGQRSISDKIKLSRSVNSRMLINQGNIDVANGDLETLENQIKLNRDEADRFRPVKSPPTIDSENIYISGQDLEYIYPTSTTNIRKNIKALKKDSVQLATENEFLPLWMLSSQDSRTGATGFIKAAPLCYCNPGEGDFVLANILNHIKTTGFSFTDFDYEVDRLIIDSTTGNSNEQYLKFQNYKYSV